MTAMTAAVRAPRPGGVLTVAVTGAAGQISYALLPLLANGQLFGPEQRISLRLLEIPSQLPTLRGVAMELQDGAYPLLHGAVTTTAEPRVALAGADLAILVGAFPRRKGLERRALLARNVGIFRQVAAALDVAAPRCHVLVVGNPANTNAWVLRRFAPTSLRARITALTRLDHNRVVAQIASRFEVPPEEVRDVCIWGNHSSTQYPDVTRAIVRNVKDVSVVEKFGGRDGLARDFIPMIQKRGAAIIAARGLSSAMSAANAIVDHLRDWVCGSDGRVVSMAVPADGSYGIRDVFFSYPVVCTGDGKYEIVKDIELDDFSKEYIRKTTEELYSERKEALTILECE